MIDSLSALLNHSFPRVLDQKGGNGASKGMICALDAFSLDSNTNELPEVPNSSARRLQVLQYIISALQKLAATHNLAIVVLTQCASKMQAERGASLIPAINASVWDQGIPTRLVLYRDWVMHEGKPLGLHFASIQKVNGKNDSGARGDTVAFGIESVRALVGGYIEYDLSPPLNQVTTSWTELTFVSSTDGFGCTEH